MPTLKKNPAINCGSSMQNIKLHDKTFGLLINHSDIQFRVQSIAEEINQEYVNRVPLFLGVLNGSFLFAADLFKSLLIDCEISFIKVSSYSGTSSTGLVKSLVGLSVDIFNRDIIIIEDIVDTGDTMKYLLEELNTNKPSSIKIATMIFKPTALKHDIKPDYVGFELPPDFIVGYGLDYNGLGRNLNDIYTLIY